MTDYEKLIEMFTSSGVRFKPELQTIKLKVSHNLSEEETKVTGYAGFYTVINFDANGKLSNLEIGE